MHWRHDVSQERPYIFGVGVVMSRAVKRHLIAGRMATKCRAGRVYFPAGSVDDNDIVDGAVDYDANRQREAMKTGLTFFDARARPTSTLA